jgi:uncharacterized membrane protein
MKTLSTPLMIVFSIVACLGAVLGWALRSPKRPVYPIQGSFEQHG